MGAIVLAPGCPERKGLVERANGYLETSFLRGRDFSSPQDFNAQLSEWLATKANTRLHAGLRCRPTERITEDLDAMMALPPVAPDVALHADTRLGRDHWVRVGTNDYSVYPRAIGRRVPVRADADHVMVTWGTEEVARHARVWVRHVTVTDEAHDRARRARAALAAVPDPAGEDGEAATPRWPRGTLPTTTGRWAVGAKDLAYLCRKLKAPSLAADLGRLGELAREQNWTHEELLAACLPREVGARHSHGGEAPHPSRPLPGPQELGGLRLRPPTLRREWWPTRRPGLRRGSPQRGIPRPARHRRRRISLTSLLCNAR